MEKKVKVLLIKLGYSETLDTEIGNVPSLGDVLRTTTVLWGIKEKYPKSEITWLVSKEAGPLLENNRLLGRVLLWNEFVPFQLMREKFDVLINLEKISGICALSDMIEAWTKYGFRFDSDTGSYHAYEMGLGMVRYIEHKKNASQKPDIWQKILIEMIGIEWKEQGYLLGYQPQSSEEHDVGLNYKVGSKWPTKAMPMEKWQELEIKLRKNGYNISWQKGITNLYEYMDWINSNRLIISHDSLGLHLALALNKKVLGIFGPTDPNEVYLYGQGKSIVPKITCSRRACMQPLCSTGTNCVERLSVDRVVAKVEKLLEPSGSTDA